MSDTPTPIAEIDHGPSKFDQFLENNQKKLVILALAIFIGVVAFVFFKGYNKMQNENAGSLLLEASSEEDYNKVISEFPSKTAAGTAAYSIASMRTSDADAIEAYNHFISTYPEHPMLALAEFNLSQHQINSDKIDEASATLEALIDRENADFITPKAKIALGDIALARGEKQQAEQLYNDAIKYNDSNHLFVIEAQTKLTYVNAIKPEIVEAPAPQQEQTSPAISTEIEPISPTKTSATEAPSTTEQTAPDAAEVNKATAPAELIAPKESPAGQ